MAARGAVLVECHVLAQARELVPAFSEAADRQPFTPREAALVVQWDAPARALGEDLGSPRLRPGLAVPVDSGDLATECARLEKGEHDSSSEEGHGGSRLSTGGQSRRRSHGLPAGSMPMAVYDSGGVKSIREMSA